MRISIQFDEYFWQKNFKILISVRFEIFTKNSYLKLVGTPCTILWQFFKIHFSIFCLKQIFGFLLPYFASDFWILNVVLKGCVATFVLFRVSSADTKIQQISKNWKFRKKTEIKKQERVTKREKIKCNFVVRIPFWIQTFIFQSSNF